MGGGEAAKGRHDGKKVGTHLSWACQFTLQWLRWGMSASDCCLSMLDRPGLHAQVFADRFASFIVRQ